MLEVAAFRQQYPEFDTLGEELIASALENAATRIDETVYGPRAELAQGLLAAHYLEISPFGMPLRLDQDPLPAERTKRWIEFANVRAEVSQPAIMVL